MNEVKNCIHISDLHETDMYQVVKDFIEEYPVKQKWHLLFITGDLTYKGQFSSMMEMRAYMDLILSEELVEDIVFIPGNHDLSFEKEHAGHRNVMGLFENQKHIHFLMHEAKEVQGIKIFGSPWTPWFYDWAFNYYNPEYPIQSDHLPKGKEFWKDIPEDTQVLLTHGPARNIRDIVLRGNKHVGCEDLQNKIIELDKKSLRFHLFGHIHETYGRTRVGNVTFLNSSIMDVYYRPLNKPQDFTLWPEE